MTDSNDICQVTFNAKGLTFYNWDDGTAVQTPWSQVRMFTGNSRKPYPTMAQARSYIAAARARLDELERKLNTDAAWVQDNCSDFDPPADWRGGGEIA